MTNHYLTVSDLHLADVEDHPDGWKAYKGSRFLWDQDFADLVERFVAGHPPGESLTLILNGDVVDFDIVTAVPERPDWPVSRSERKRGLNASEDKSVFKLRLVLDQHPLFVETLAKFLGGGHTLVYIMGNHDREFHFAKVQQAFMDSLRVAANSHMGSFRESAVQFEPWFFAVPGEIYVEHGQQYDHYTSFRNLLEPTVEIKGQETIALPMGNLSNRFLMPQMGFFNPHASDYILNVYAYFWHWLKNYAFSRRSLALTWLWGSLVVMGKLLRIRKKLMGRSQNLLTLLPPIAQRYALPVDTVRALYNLRDVPITSRFFRIIREFWIDRLLMALIMTGGTVALALVPIPLWIKLMVPLSSFPLVYFIYEWAVQGESIFTAETRMPDVARQVADLVPVRLVVFGHTHSPRLIPLSRQTSFVDTGTWAPITRGESPGQLVPGLRNYLEASFTDGEPAVCYASWQEDGQDSGSEGA